MGVLKHRKMQIQTKV